MREFERNPDWSKESLLDVSRKTGLSEAQVYKWGWDQKRKKFGPEAVANMLPFDRMMGSGDTAFTSGPFGQNGLDIINEEGSSSDEDDFANGLEDLQPDLHHSKSDFNQERQSRGYPTPFLDESPFSRLEEEKAIKPFRLLAEKPTDLKASSPVFKIDLHSNADNTPITVKDKVKRGKFTKKKEESETTYKVSAAY